MVRGREGEAAGEGRAPHGLRARLARWGLTRADVAFVAVTLAVAAGVAVWQWAPAWGAPSDASDEAAAGPYAVIQNTEGFYEALPLSQDASVTVASSRGTNVVEVADGRVRVSSSDCANQVCVEAGWDSAEGQTITCLPHQLVVQVVSTPADATPLR